MYNYSQPHRFFRQLLSLSAAILLCTQSVHAFASPLMETTGGQLGPGGFNARFTTSGSAAAYFNPAYLSQADNGISIGFMVFQDNYRIRLHSREGTGVNVPDFPDTLQYTYGARSQNFDNLTFPTDDLYRGCTIDENPCRARPRQGEGSSFETRPYALVGLVNQIVEEKLVVGLYAVLPLGEYTSAHSFFPDEREQFFTNSLHPTLYSDRLRAPSLSIGVGSEFVDGLSIGVALTIALLNNADAGVYVPNAGNQRETLLLSTDVGVTAKVAPHFAINYEPTDGLTFSFTAHSPSRFEINTGFANLLPNGDEQIAVRKSVHDYMPWIFGIGAEYRFDTGNFDLGFIAGLEVGLWKNYINRVGETPSAPYEWSNTVTPSLGIRFADENWNFLVDATYEPTPVPDQTGRTNYVDNRMVTSMLGGEYKFDVGDEDIRLGVGGSLQGHLILDRLTRKKDPNLDGAITNPLHPDYGEGIDRSLVRDELPDSLEYRVPEGEPFEPADGLQTNNPGYPGYTTDGYMWGAQLHFSIYY